MFNVECTQSKEAQGLLGTRDHVATFSKFLETQSVQRSFCATIMPVGSNLNCHFSCDRKCNKMADAQFG